MEEDLHVNAIELSAEVQAVGEFREWVTNLGLVAVVYLAIAVEVFVAGIAGMHTDCREGNGRHAYRERKLSV